MSMTRVNQGMETIVCIYHSLLWAALVEEGWFTMHVENELAIMGRHYGFQRF